MAHRFALAYRRASDLASPPVLAHLDQALDACGRQDPTDLTIALHALYRALDAEVDDGRRADLAGLYLYVQRRAWAADFQAGAAVLGPLRQAWAAALSPTRGRDEPVPEERGVPRVQSAMNAAPTPQPRSSR